MFQHYWNFFIRLFLFFWSEISPKATWAHKLLLYYYFSTTAFYWREKKTFSIKLFFLMNTTPESSRNMSEKSFRWKIYYVWLGGKKSYSGPNSDTSCFEQITELQPVKMRHFNVLCAPTGERYAVKRVRNVSVYMCMCAHACTDSAALPLLPAGKKTFLGSFRTVCVPCDGPQPRDFQVFLLASNL